MTKKWSIRLSDKSDKQFGKLDKPVQKQIRSFLREKLGNMENPRQTGHALTGNLSSFWRYRVGDYRLVCSIKDKEVTVLVVHIGHRKEIYH